MASHSTHRSSSSHHRESDRGDRDPHHLRSSTHRESKAPPRPSSSRRDSKSHGESKSPPRHSSSRRDSKSHGESKSPPRHSSSLRDSKSRRESKSPPQRHSLSHRDSKSHSESKTHHRHSTSHRQSKSPRRCSRPQDSERRTIPQRSSPVPSPTRSRPLPPPRSRPLPPPQSRPLPPPPSSASPHVSASAVGKDAAAVRILGRLSAEPHPPANSPPKSPPPNTPPKTPLANSLPKTPQANSPPKSPLVVPRRPRSQAVRRNPSRHAAVSRPAPVDDEENEENVKVTREKNYTVKQTNDLMAGVKKFQPILGFSGKKLWLVLQKTYPSIALRTVSGLKHKCKALIDQGTLVIEDGEDIMDNDHADLVESVMVAMCTNDQFIKKIGEHVLTVVQEDKVECILECVKEVMNRLKEEN